MSGKMIVADDITHLIGRTPLLRIRKVVGPGDATLLVKLEWYNIGGSVKDRVALYLLEYARSEGSLVKDKTILEATSGNTGIALSMIAAARGYPITIVMPESVSRERRKIIQAYGAELILTPGAKGTGGAVEVKKQLLAEHPDRYLDIDQFRDSANVLAHYQTTGKEILEQTGGRVDMVVVGVGTAGTGVGIAMRLKQYNPGIRVVGVMPKLGVSIQGLRNPGEPNPTQLFRRGAFDESIELGPEEIPATVETARRLSREEGLLVGYSSGAIAHVALLKARELGKGKMIVAVLPDSGERYLSTALFDQ